MLLSMSVLLHHTDTGGGGGGGERVEESRQQNYTRRRSNDTSVEEEYLCAIRTNSYTDLCVQVRDQRSSSNKASQETDYTLLLEPKQETLASIIRNTNYHLPYLLLDFFNTTLHACNFCGSLVESIHRARANHLELINQARVAAADDRYRSAVAKLQRFCGRLNNPFAGSSRAQLERIHGAYDPLARRLMSAHRRAARRLSCASFAARIVSFLGAAEGSFAREEAQVGAAARGAFALDRDFDTVSSMVGRLCDEIERTRDVIGLLLVGGDDPGGELMLREVVRELRARECGFMDQLKELEEHVFLSFLNINRARRMVLQEIVPHQQN